MAKYIYKIDKNNKIAFLKAIESLHPFVRNISEKLKDYNAYYVRVYTQQEEFSYGISEELYKEWISEKGYIPRDITFDCINIGDIL